MGIDPDVVSQARRWWWQRVSAMVLALCVLVHLVVIVYAVRGGLSGAEILERTRGSLLFGGFYTVFVLACAVHVPIGMARVAEEWLGWRAQTARRASWCLGALLLALGGMAVAGVVAG
jgi:fumarate reductase subunit C